MRLLITHTTTFTYTEPISEAYTEMRLKPLDGGGQHCLSFKLDTAPRGSVMNYVDRFGNDVRHFDTINPHQRLEVSTISDVFTARSLEDEERDLTQLDQFDYLTSSTYSLCTDALRDFAAPFMVPGNIEASALALMEGLYLRLQYEPGVTDVTTDAETALGLGRGVCQDFAHIMIAGCRCNHIVARYVSGYLYSPRVTDAPEGNAASHAWVDVFIPNKGWISLDPTHNSPQNESYVRVAVGRDYADVPPTKGVFKGNAKEKLDVTVKVKAV
jgi:transglutaminase-like putative cysteine protease